MVLAFAADDRAERRSSRRAVTLEGPPMREQVTGYGPLAQLHRGRLGPVNVSAEIPATLPGLPPELARATTALRRAAT